MQDSWPEAHPQRKARYTMGRHAHAGGRQLSYGGRSRFSLYSAKAADFAGQSGTTAVDDAGAYHRKLVKSAICRACLEGSSCRGIQLLRRGGVLLNNQRRGQYHRQRVTRFEPDDDRWTLRFPHDEHQRCAETLSGLERRAELGGVAGWQLMKRKYPRIASQCLRADGNIGPLFRHFAIGVRFHSA